MQVHPPAARRTPRTDKTHSAVRYPEDALVRVAQICRNPRTGEPGLLPIHPSTWWKWVATGRVPPGRKIGSRTTAWPVSVVLAVGKPEKADA